MYEYPKLPEEIGKALNDNYLAIFIGAGVSVDIGLSVWTEIKDKLIDEAKKYEPNVNLQNLDDKKAISFSQIILDENEDNLFNKILKEKMTITQKINENNTYYNILDLIKEDTDNFRGILLTTNIDLALHNVISEDEIVVCNTSLNDNVIHDIQKVEKYYKLIHLHGCINDYDSIVFTSKQYIPHYNNQIYQELLSILFKSYTILFVGYSLSEMEFLDYLLEKLDWDKQQKHFVLMGFNEKQSDNTINIHKKYYSDFGIQMIPYKILKDHNHENLNKILYSWSKEFKETTLPKNSEQINKIVLEFSENNDSINKKKTEQLIKSTFNRLNNVSYLIHKIINIQNTEKWFEKFIELKLLTADIISKNNNIIYYIHHLSLMNNNKINQKLINLITELSENIAVDDTNVSLRYYDTIVSIIFSLDNNLLNSDLKDYGFKIISHKIDYPLIHNELEKTVIKNLIKNNDRIYLNKIFDYILNSNSYKHFSPRINTHILDRIIKEHITILSSKYQSDMIKIIESVISNIITTNKYKLDNILFIKNYEPYYSEEQSLKILINFLRDLIVYNDDINSNINILRNYYNKKETIYNRIAIYCVDKKYDNYKTILWASEKNPLCSKYKNEMIPLIENNSPLFNSNEIKQFINWVEELSNNEFNYSINKEDLDNYKYSWLKLIKNDDESLKNLINKYELNDCINYNLSVDEHKRLTSTPSPDYLEYMIKKSFKEVVDYIKSKPEKNFIDNWNLEKSFEVYVKEKHTEIFNNISMIERLPKDYINIFLYVIEQENMFSKISEKQIILDLINSLIKHETLNHNIIYSIQKILREYIKNKIEKKYTLKTIDNLNNFLKEDEKKDIPPIFDYFNDFNSRNYELMVYYLVIINNNDIKCRIDKLLNNKMILYWLGFYSINLLEEKWFKDNMVNIFNSNLWQYSLFGYLNRNVYKDKIMKYLVINGIITKAINSEFKNEFFNYLIINIIKYNLQYENEEYLYSILEDSTEEQVSNLIIYLSTLDETNEYETEYVHKIWNYIVSKYAHNKNIKQDLLYLFKFVNEINEKIYEKIELTIKSLDPDSNNDEAYEMFNRLVDKHPKEISQLICKIPKNIWYQDEIKDIIHKLRENNHINSAKKIVDACIKKGLYLE